MYVQSTTFGDRFDLDDTNEQKKSGFESLMNQMTPMSLLPPPPPPVRLGYWTLWLLSQPASRHTVSVALSKQIDLISRHMMCKGLCWRKGCDVRFWCCHQRAKPLSPWSVQPPRLPPSSLPSHPPPPPHPRLFLAQRTGSLPRYTGSR